MSMKKMFWSYLAALPIGLAVSCYTTFVLQNLWNWFAVKALQAPSISFWEMYALVLVVGLFSMDHPERFAEEQLWKSFATLLDACVPEGKRQAVEEALEEQTEGVWIGAWIAAGSAAFGKLVGNTYTLAVGWAIHVFLT